MMMFQEKRRLAMIEGITEEHFQTLYRILTPGCSLKPLSNWNFYSTLPRECPANPNCFVGIFPSISSRQELTAEEKKAEIELLKKEIGDDPRPLVRQQAIPFVGLHNLGSTCYMNALLQVLYSNKPLRLALFEWHPCVSSKDTEKRNEVMEELRKLLSEMQITVRTAISPASFLRSLNLPTGIQQDAAEFHKLLMQLIEDRMSLCGSESAKKLFHGLFDGSFLYTTECKSCRHQLQSSDKFSELKIPLNGDTETIGLKALIEKAFANEELPGRDCDNCHRKSDAVRSTFVNTFPKLLIFELLRFTYDPITKANKKVGRFVEIPEEIDLNNLVSQQQSHLHQLRQQAQQQEPTKFSLSAIVCHIGSSANSGHYVSYVLNDNDNSWWRFDDSIVRKCDEFPFSKKKLSTQQQPQQQQKQQQQSTSNFYPTSGYEFEHYNFSSPITTYSSSGNEVPMEVDSSTTNETPYILFYKREDLPMISHTKVPSNLALELQRQSDELSASAEHYSEREKAAMDEIRAHRQQVLDIAEVITVPPEVVTYHWISVAWLTTFVKSPFHVPQIDNSPLLCPHGGVAFGKKKVLTMKRISNAVWKLLSDKFGGGPELTNDSECSKCVIEWQTRYRNKEKSQEEKHRLDFETNVYSSYGSYWVSKKFIENWLKLKLLPESVENPTKAITCAHGKLIPDNGIRVKIGEPLWKWLISHLKEKEKVVEFPCEAGGSCPECLKGVQAQQEQEADANAAKVGFRSSIYFPPEKLYDLRPNSKLFVVPEGWFKMAKLYVDHLSRSDSPGPIETKSLLCEHGKLMFNVLDEFLPTLGKVKRIALIKEESWNIAVQLFGVRGPPITFFCTENRSAWNEDRTSLVSGITDPEQCSECIAKRLKLDEAEKFVYQDRKLIIEEESLTGWNRQKAEIDVSSTTTIGELRLLALQSFDIPPMCQKLMYKDHILDRDKLTLGDYNIPHSSVIYVKRVPEGSYIILEENDSPAPANKKQTVAFEGTSFAGTSLSSSTSSQQQQQQQQQQTIKTETQRHLPKLSSSSPQKPTAKATTTTTTTHNTSSHVTEPMPITQTKPQVKPPTNPRQPILTVTPISPSNEISCPKCTYLNKINASKCEICDAALY